MNDDDLQRALSAARPDTAADDGWTDSADGRAALARIHDTAGRTYATRGVRIRLPRSAAAPQRRRVLAGLAAAAVVVTGASLVLGNTVGGTHHAPAVAERPDLRLPAQPSGGVAPGTVRPAQLLLAGYDTCGALLDGLRTHTAAHVTADGLPSAAVYPGAYRSAASGPVPTVGVATDAGVGAPAHSGTNDQETGADEPDTVKTDGRRIVSVTAGVLHVVDVASRRQTGSLDLGAYAGADSASLLLSGDRLLVTLGATSGAYPLDSYPLASPGNSTVLLIDLATATPRIVSMFRPKGQLVDARLIDGTARLVVRSTPDLQLRPAHEKQATARKADYAAQVRRAPLSAWLPGWSVTTGTAIGTHRLGCGAVSHPAAYTGLSMLTIYSVDPTAGFGDVAPVSLAADGNTVYATTSSLYVASETDTGSSTDTTELHRFDIRGPGAPVYLGSGTVPGSVADSYSLSEWQGSLRAVTTRWSGNGEQSHDLYVLDAARLTRLGHVGGLGDGEELHAVRFLGDLGYVVTYQQVDPLFVLDLRDPRHPRKAGELTVTGYSGYLHDVGDGRLLGVGEATVPNADEGGEPRPVGLQVQLFDVHDPAAPTALSKVVRSGALGGDIDPHAFLYWPARHLAVVPVPTYEAGDEGRALLVRVDGDRLTSLGTVANPADDTGQGITRSIVIGDALWTVSDGGLVATDLDTLRRQATVPFA